MTTDTLMRSRPLEYHVGGHLQMPAPGRLEGWCWAPDRPHDRQEIEILCNDQVVATLEAASFRPDIARRGIGDGRHGFALALPEANAGPGPALISARARRTGQVFGRVDCDDGSRPPPMRPELDAVGGELAELWRALRAPPPLPLDGVGRGFARVGARLAKWPDAPGAGDVDAALGDLLRRFPAFALPYVAAPKTSIVLRAGRDFGTSFNAVAALAPALLACEAEIVLLDGGADPAMALIPAVIGNLAYVPAPGTGVDGARGRFLLWLDAAGAVRSAAALCDVLGYVGEGRVVIGRRVLRAAAARGMAARLEAPPRPAMPGVSFDMAMERDRFQALGGFDPAVDDEGGLGQLDLALRAVQAGAEIVPVVQPEPASGAAMDNPPPDMERAAICAMAFHRRWGIGGAGWQAALR